MAENTEISWTDATFNPWMGCTKVGPGCDHCYAEELMDKRYGKVIWGVGAERVRTGVKNWNLPKRWNARPFYECRECGWRGDNPGVLRVGSGDVAVCPVPTCAAATHVTRRRVFCSSLADVFDNEVDPQWRVDLFALIHATPNLDWLLLTKRIGNAMRMMLDAGLKEVPGNVWLGATIVNQEEADRDIHKLLAVPARVRFLSMEPLLGPVDLTRVRAIPHNAPINVLKPSGCAQHAPGYCLGDCQWRFHRGIDWVIVGGESGKQARPMHPDWVRSLRDQCKAAGAAFHSKQWGEWKPLAQMVVSEKRASAITAHMTDDTWIRLDGTTHTVLRDDHEPYDVTDALVRKVGKKAAGRELDGRTHNEFPRVTP